MRRGSMPVAVFTNTTCPIVQKYWPKLKRLNEQFESLGVQFVSMNSSDGDEIAEIAQQAIQYDVPIPMVKDVNGDCAKALGVTRTPEVVVVDAEGNALGAQRSELLTRRTWNRASPWRRASAHARFM